MGKGLSAVAGVREDRQHCGELFTVGAERGEGASTVGHVGRGHSDGVRQTLCIHRDMTFDPGDLLAGVVPFLSGGVGVFDALRINDAKACFVFAPLFRAGRANLIFSRPAPAGLACLASACGSRSKNTHAPSAILDTLLATSATGTRFSKDIKPRKIPRANPPSSAWSSCALSPTSLGFAQTVLD